MQRKEWKGLIVAALLIGASVGHAESEPIPPQTPASPVISVPESPAPRAAQRDTQKEPPVAEEPEASWLTGDWAGARTNLSDHGVDLAFILKYDAGRNLAGGNKIGSFGLWNFDARLSLDTEKAGLWKNGSFFLYYILNDGDNPSEFVGDRQVTSNIEASPMVSRLYEAWYQHLFYDGKASVLLGVHDLNSEFYVTPTSGLFLNSSFGVGHELAQTGEQGPTIFPVTSPGIRLRAEPTKEVYVQFALFNGVAGDPNFPDGTHFRFTPDDGFLLIAEAAWLPSFKDGDNALASKYAVGGWTYTKQVNEISGNQKANNSGAYILIDQTMSPRAAGFLRAGVANAQVNEASSDVAAGLTYRTRKNDIVGVAVTAVTASTPFKDVQAAAGTPIEDRETTYEVTYRAEIVPGFALQPDWQYIDRPSFSSSVSYASVINLRAEFSF